MDLRLKQVRKDIRYYHKQLTKHGYALTQSQKHYILTEYTNRQKEHRLITGKNYKEYYLPAFINDNCNWIV